jgi:3-deoxy-7-phosphoheptulonate synthase
MSTRPPVTDARPATRAHQQPTHHQPQWPDPAEAAAVRQDLATRPALVTGAEVEGLLNELDAAAQGHALVLQAGDCAERFADANGPTVRRRAAQLDALASTLGEAACTPVVRIGRIAGQYGKPRSSPWEAGPDGQPLASYLGDAVNDPALDPTSRRPDPQRLLTAYRRAEQTLAHLRGLARNPAGRPVYTAHEMLLLDYEEPLVRDEGADRYATSGHFLWIGNRTRTLDGPHVRLAVSVRNPLGVKLGPTATAAEAVELSLRLNPLGRPGRLAFIVRMGADRIDRLLPPMVRAVARWGAPVAWVSDPMHGNTIPTRHGRKTRSLPMIERELTSFARILRELGLRPAGLHLELTPDDVTECVAEPPDRAMEALLPRYRSACDPRLDPAQAARVVRHFSTLL